MISDRIMPGTDWITVPSLGDTYRTQGKPDTGRRLRITSAGELYLIRPGETTEEVFGTVTAGEVIDQFHDGIGLSTTCGVDTVQF